MFKQIDPGEPRIGINKGYVILKSIFRRNVGKTL